MDNWSKALFFAIVLLFIFMVFFQMETISEMMAEGLMNMQ